MKLAEKVRVGGLDYSVAYEERLFIDDKRCFGLIDYERHEIKIDPSLQDEQGERETLLHEMMHAIAHHFSLDVQNDENVIDSFAKGLAMVIRDNPELFERTDAE